MRRFASALVVLALTPAAAAAQPARASAVVKIDFRALTEDGQQVGDLKPDEVALKINGKLLARSRRSAGSRAPRPVRRPADRRCRRPTPPTRSARTAA